MNFKPQIILAMIVSILGFSLAVSSTGQASVNRANKAYETEKNRVQRMRSVKSEESKAKIYVGSMNRAQQAYFLEKNAFSKTIASLQLRSVPMSQQYTYSIEVKGNVVMNYGVPKRSDLKGYVGGVIFLGNDQTTKGAMLSGVLCENVKPGKARPQKPMFDAMNGGVCTVGTQRVR